MKWAARGAKLAISSCRIWHGRLSPNIQSLESCLQARRRVLKGEPVSSLFRREKSAQDQILTPNVLQENGTHKTSSNFCSQTLHRLTNPHRLQQQPKKSIPDLYGLFRFPLPLLMHYAFAQSSFERVTRSQPQFQTFKISFFFFPDSKILTDSYDYIYWHYLIACPIRYMKGSTQ